jgi:N-acetylmuramoyl-L-alanine amidase
MDELVHREQPSPNWDARDERISMVVLHYTDMPSADAALARLCDPAAKVSAHYVITEEGEVVQLVDESRRAWHAGRSFWRGKANVNGASIGIELANPGHTCGYRPFPEAQIEALVPLLHRIVKTYDIPRANVVGHSDVAPQRKLDPGELFPWERLAEYRLALPRPAKLDLGVPLDNHGVYYLAHELIGFVVCFVMKSVEAIQRRWRPEKIDGEVDGQIRAILFQLLLDRDQGRTR